MSVTVAKPIEVNRENVWRTKSPSIEGWARSAQPDAANKYFIASVDCHITPPSNLVSSRIDAKYREKLPRMEVRDDGRYMIVDGKKPFRLVDSKLEGEDAYRSKGGCIGKDDPDADMALFLADMDRDGIDWQLVFPNGAAITPFHTTDTDFAMAQFRIYNDWAAELNKKHGKRVNVAPCATSYNVDEAIVEMQRVAKLGHTAIALPTHALPTMEGQNLGYNHKMFEPLWDAIEDLNLIIAWHVATGADPRKASGPGGAIMNRAKSHEMMVDPITAFCSSGILDRHPTIRFACIEGGGGWLPSLLDLMDETYIKHHMWVRPKLEHGLPSDYFRAHGAASFQEDRSAVILCEPYELTNNLMWSNDYPHHEGTFPHSAAAIERQFGIVSEETRAKVLGLNAARFFGVEVPEKYRA